MDIKEITKLAEQLKKLQDTPFEENGIEKLKRFSQEVVEISNDLDKSLKEANQILGNYFNDRKKIFEDLNNIQEEYNQKLREIEKLEEKHKYKSSKEWKEKEDIEKYEKLIGETKKYEKVLNKVGSAAQKYLQAAIQEQEILNKRIVEGTTNLDDFGEKIEQRTRALRKGFNEIKDGARAIGTNFKNLIEPWVELDASAMDFAKTIGMSQKTAEKYRKDTIKFITDNNIGSLYNKSSQELIQLQKKYSDVLGRNVKLSSEQTKDMLAIEAFLGEDAMADIANNLENFGLGMSDTANFVKKTYDNATKYGISASKLTNTVRENIKMAQDYSFKNGLDGLTSMAKKAIQLKTELSLVNGFLEKTSTVEGAITTGANLQVLGGTYAMGSDPLSMMYESLNDMEGLFDRAVNMAKGKVFYNEKTKNFEMANMDRYMMKQAATQMGIDPSKLIDVAFRNASLSKIESQVKLNKNIAGDKDLVDMVKNLATWDNGEAVIDINGKKKNVKDITSADKAQLEAMQLTDSQNLQSMAIDLRSLKAMGEGMVKESKDKQAEAMEPIADSLKNFIGQNQQLVNALTTIMAWGSMIASLGGILAGVWATALGVRRLGPGLSNLTRGLGRGNSVGGTGGFSKGTPKTFLGKNGKEYMNIGNGQYKRISDGRVISGSAAKGLAKSDPALAAAGNVAKTGKLAKFAKFGGSAAGGALLGGALAGAISLGTDMASGEYAKDKQKSWIDAGGASAGAAAGAALGSLIPIPVVGTLIGGAIGGLIGGLGADWITGTQKQDRLKERERIARNHPDLAEFFIGETALQGNYSIDDLNTIKDALSDRRFLKSEVSGSLLDKIKANDDLSLIESKGVVTDIFGSGGFVYGKSHEKGGVNAELEGGEYVVNKNSTAKNLPLLEKINNSDYNFASKQPLGEQMKVHETAAASMAHNNVNVSPISINLSGTIKLDTGKNQVDISKELLNNPQLISSLTNMISKQLNILDNGSYNKGKYLQKFS